MTKAETLATPNIRHVGVGEVLEDITAGDVVEIYPINIWAHQTPNTALYLNADSEGRHYFLGRNPENKETLRLWKLTTGYGDTFGRIFYERGCETEDITPETENYNDFNEQLNEKGI